MLRDITALGIFTANVAQHLFFLSSALYPRRFLGSFAMSDLHIGLSLKLCQGACHVGFIIFLIPVEMKSTLIEL